MGFFYSFESDIDYWEYAVPDFSMISTVFKSACIMSEFQYLDRKKIEISTTKESGNIFPDYYYNPADGIPLISERLKRLFDEFGIENLFYKQILLKNQLISKEAIFYLALPPRISCIDTDNSVIDQYIGDTEQICIDEFKTGNYNIFKLSEVNNNEIIISDKLYQYLSTQNNLISVYFNQL